MTISYSLIQTWKNNNLLYSVIFAILAFFTLVRFLEIFDVVFTQTILRITYPQIFLFYLTGSPITDNLAIVSLGIASTFILLHPNRLAFILTGIFLTATVFSLVTSNVFIADVLSLIIFPFISLLALFARRRLRIQSRIKKDSLILSLALVFLSVEVWSIINWIVYPISPSRVYSGVQWYGADLQAKLTQVFAILSPIMMVLLMFWYGIRPSSDLIRSLISYRLNLVSTTNYSKQRIRLELADEPYRPSQQHILPHYPRFLQWFVLFGSCLLLIGLTIYPYLPSINPDFQIVSVDASFYVNQITLMKNEGLFAERGPFGEMNDRSFSLVIFYGIALLTNQSPLNVIAFMPAFLGTLNVISIFFLARHVSEKTEHKSFLLIAPIFAALSHQFIVGFYGGFLSNMLALPLAFFAILFFLRYWEGNRKWFSFTLFATLISLTLLIHIYTWIFFATTIIVTAVAFALNRDNGDKQSKVKRLLAIITATIAMAVFVVVIASILGQSSGLDRIINLATTNTSEEYFAQRWFNINYVFRIYLGGFLANPLMLLLALVWIYGVRFKHNHFGILIASAISISSIFFFIGDNVIQSRMFYNIPIQIPAAITAANILDGKYLGTMSFRGRLLIVGLIIAFLVSYALMSLANFYLLDFTR